MKHRKSTKFIEAVETHQLAKSLSRLDFRWKRALYHAIQIAGCHTNRDELTKIREALGLA